MLVVCNGAYKSGSTWLYNIVRALGGFEDPPARYLNAGWKNPSIAPDRLAPFLREMDLQRTDILCKQHFFTGHQRALLLASPEVRVLDIERDLRDVVVSAWHHHLRAQRFVGPFEAFYWIEGRVIADHVRRYHQFWAGPEGRTFCASYERLQTDFATETGRIAAFLGRAVADERLADVRAATTLDALRARYGEASRTNGQSFFRRGAVGDWQHHFTSAMLDDLERVAEHGLTRHEWLTARLRTKLHRLLKAAPARRRAERRGEPGRVRSSI